MHSAKLLRQTVTETLVQAISSGKTPPWRKPWCTGPNSGAPANIDTAKPYRGVNPLLLQVHADHFGFQSKWWGTFKQWQSRGCQVKKRPSDVRNGLWGCRVVFYSPRTRTVVTPSGEDHTQRFFLLRSFVVFNADQVEGAGQWQLQAPRDQPVPLDCDPAERLIAGTGAVIRYGGTKACYSADEDAVYLPHRFLFSPVTAFYETAFHELAHWGERRLGWRRDDSRYALGELIAELASVFVCQGLGIPVSETIMNHAGYLEHWLDQMRQDSHYIFVASQQASSVADYLLRFASADPTVGKEPSLLTA